jgi:excisionase family DNA binding protein
METLQIGQYVTIYRLLKKRDIPGALKVGRVWRFDLDEFKRFLEREPKGSNEKMALAAEVSENDNQSEVALPFPTGFGNSSR